MIKSYFIILTLLTLYHFELSISDDTCRLDAKPKLRIVFVVSYSLNREGHWTKYQNQTAGHLIDFLKKDFPDTEYAVTGYQDYPDSAKPQQRAITDENRCYFLMEEWSSDKNRIVKSISTNLGYGRNEHDGRDFSDSVTMALLNTAVEKKLKWDKGFVNSNGKTVRNIMVLFTNKNITKVLKAPGSRTRPKADGTDTCQTALPPQLKQLSNVLYENGFTLINGVMNFHAAGELVLLENHYAKEFGSLLVPYYQVPFLGPGKPAEDKFYNATVYRTYAEKFYNIIKQEAMVCDWEDPKGYNSLGL